MDIGYLAVDIPDGGLTPMNVESCFVIVAPTQGIGAVHTIHYSVHNSAVSEVMRC